jgi:N-acetylglutamate synthase-like GNAT family acetyltransferase
MFSEDPEKQVFKDDGSHFKFFVETSEGGISGSILAVMKNDRVAELRDFYIVEGAEDSGLRSQLLEKAIDYCRRQNMEAVKAVTFPDLSSFFQKKGFTCQKRFRDYIFSGEETVLMTKKLKRT